MARMACALPWMPNCSALRCRMAPAIERTAVMLWPSSSWSSRARSRGAPAPGGPGWCARLWSATEGGRWWRRDSSGGRRGGCSCARTRARGWRIPAGAGRSARGHRARARRGSAAAARARAGSPRGWRARARSSGAHAQPSAATRWSQASSTAREVSGVSTTSARRRRAGARRARRDACCTRTRPARRDRPCRDDSGRRIAAVLRRRRRLRAGWRGCAHAAKPAQRPRACLGVAVALLRQHHDQPLLRDPGGGLDLFVDGLARLAHPRLRPRLINTRDQHGEHQAGRPADWACAPLMSPAGAGWPRGEAAAAPIAKHEGLAQAERGVADDAAPLGGEAGRGAAAPRRRARARRARCGWRQDRAFGIDTRALRAGAEHARVAVEAQQQEALRLGLDEAVLDEAGGGVEQRVGVATIPPGRRRRRGSRAGRRPGQDRTRDADLAGRHGGNGRGRAKPIARSTPPALSASSTVIVGLSSWRWRSSIAGAGTKVSRRSWSKITSAPRRSRRRVVDGVPDRARRRRAPGEAGRGEAAGVGRLDIAVVVLGRCGRGPANGYHAGFVPRMTRGGTAAGPACMQIPAHGCCVPEQACSPNGTVAAAPAAAPRAVACRGRDVDHGTCWGIGTKGLRPFRAMQDNGGDPCCSCSPA